MKLEIRKPDARTGKRRDAYVAFLSRDPKTGAAFGELPGEIRRAARKAAPPEAGADGTLFSAPLPAGFPAMRLYVLGTGKPGAFSPRKARFLLRAATKTLAKQGERSAILDFPAGLERMDAAESREFLLRTAALSGYAFDRYKSRVNGKEPPRLDVVDWNASGAAWKGVSRARAARELSEALVVAEVSSLVRDLGNTPACDLPPRVFAGAAKDAAKARELKATVLDRRAIRKERMRGLLAVSSGSEEEPRLVVLEYEGGAKGDRPIALVGKGVTFDAGGISLKPAEKMGEMKWDMMGAATVLGVMLAATDLKLGLNLVGVAPLVENLPSGSAYKPGDLIRFRNGKTAEIDNTDAEGRVILADALDYVSEWNPEVIVDYATLTGAAMVALGLEAAILFSADDALSKELVSAGERTDERLWRLPLWEDYKENLRSDWADVKNTGGRWGGAINGAMFLKEFVPEGTPWAHLDIAPTANYDREHAGYGPGATAFGVALTLRWLRDRAAKKAAG